MRKASNGEIWVCKIETAVAPKDGARRVMIEKNEKVEFRYWWPATVRTIDGLYLPIPEQQFYENFEYVGRIFEDVYRRNSNSTKQILEAELYEIETDELA